MCLLEGAVVRSARQLVCTSHLVGAAVLWGSLSEHTSHLRGGAERTGSRWAHK